MNVRDVDFAELKTVYKPYWIAILFDAVNCLQLTRGEAFNSFVHMCHTWARVISIKRGQRL